MDCNVLDSTMKALDAANDANRRQYREIVMSLARGESVEPARVRESLILNGRASDMLAADVKTASERLTLAARMAEGLALRAERAEAEQRFQEASRVLAEVEKQAKEMLAEPRRLYYEALWAKTNAQSNATSGEWERQQLARTADPSIQAQYEWTRVHKLNPAQGRVRWCEKEIELARSEVKRLSKLAETTAHEAENLRTHPHLASDARRRAEATRTALASAQRRLDEAPRELERAKLAEQNIWDLLQHIDASKADPSAFPLAGERPRPPCDPIAVELVETAGMIDDEVA
jgi:hypothetical protein